MILLEKSNRVASRNRFKKRNYFEQKLGISSSRNTFFVESRNYGPIFQTVDLQREGLVR